MKTMHSNHKFLRPTRLAALLSAVLAGAPVGAQTAAAEAPVPTLSKVTVKAKAIDTTLQHLEADVDGGALGNRTQLETPFSTTVVTSEDMDRRQVGKLGDVFALDASVTDNSSQSGAWANYMSVRGLVLDWQNGYRIDGKPFISYVTTLPYEQLDQVQLLKGATGFMYGYAAPGGVINYVTRKPVDEPIRDVTVGYKSSSLWRESIDLGDRVGENGWFGYRLNATHEEGDTYNKGSIYRDAVSLALDARLSERLTWDMQAMYQKRDAIDADPTIYTGQLAGFSLPDPVRNDSRRLVGPGTYADNEFRYFSTGLKYKLSPNWTASTYFSHATTRTRRNEEVIFLQDAAGNYDDYRSDYGEYYQFNSWQAQLDGKFTTGSVKHDVIAGVSWQGQHNDYSAAGFYQKIGTGSLWQQNQNSYYSSGTMDNGLAMYRAVDIEQQSAYLSDTLTFSENWSLLAGVRYTNYRQRGFLPSGQKDSSYTKNGVITPTVALMYNLSPQTMVYASYVESLEPGKTVPNFYSNADTLLDPLKSRQYELGVKTEQDGWAATAAVFRIEKAAEYANASNELVQDGEALYQGIEAGASFELGNDWIVGGNVMLLDSEYRKGLNNIGQRVAGSPRLVAALQVGYDVPAVPGLQLFADAKYTAATPLRPSNDIDVDAYTLFNIGANYETQINGYDTTFRLAVNNVTNKKYWMYQYSDYIKAGDPRTINLSATFRY
ncbi:MAG: TonB-dependent siderophore receptor [Burkholderiaceae bacterium]